MPARYLLEIYGKFNFQNFTQGTTYHHPGLYLKNEKNIPDIIQRRLLRQRTLPFFTINVQDP